MRASRRLQHKFVELAIFICPFFEATLGINLVKPHEVRDWPSPRYPTGTSPAPLSLPVEGPSRADLIATIACDRRWGQHNSLCLAHIRFHKSLTLNPSRAR